MALTALKGKKLKKRAPRARARTGVNAAPVEKGFDAVMYYFHNEIEKKDILEQVKTYIKSNFSKSDTKYILANPDYKLNFAYRAATAFWYNTGQTPCDRSEYYKDALNKRLADLVDTGKALHDEAKKARQQQTVTVSPQQRLQRKIADTILQDLSSLEEAWMDGEKASINVYDLFRKHGLTGSATQPVRTVVEGWLSDYDAAYNKTDVDAVEGYAHLKRPELNRRIKECNAMLEDLERIKAATKATRKSSVKKAPSLDKQVSKVKYKKEDKDFKIVSINPATFIGKHRLIVFNTKYRKLIEYVTESPDGFIVSGTTIKNISPESRSYTLRKPMDILPKVLSSTPKQFDLLMKEITTKPTTPNGRLNEETILLKVLN